MRDEPRAEASAVAQSKNRGFVAMPGLPSRSSRQPVRLRPAGYRRSIAAAFGRLLSLRERRLERAKGSRAARRVSGIRAVRDEPRAEASAVAQSKNRGFVVLLVKSGAGEGNRTLVCSLGSCRSTIELRPHAALISTTGCGDGTVFMAGFKRSRNSPGANASRPRLRGNRYRRAPAAGPCLSNA